MTTIIHSNGSKWAGQLPDSLPDLFAVLDQHALCRTFEAHGNFVIRDETAPETVHFFGNFANFSHVFRIQSDDPETIAALTAAIRANQQRADYLSQETPAERKARHDAIDSARRAERQAEREKHARTILGL